MANQAHVSASDPDATLVSRPRVHKKLCYKAHFSADADSRMITDCHATTGARHECPILPERIAYQREDLELPIEDGDFRRYRITGGHCRHCPMSGNCLPDNQKFRARFVYRGIYQDEVEVVRRRQRTATFRQRLVERKWKIEGLFGEAKQNHSLRRARYHGLSKVQIQFFMIAIALNCKRAVTISSLLRLIDLILRRLSRHQPYSSTTLSGQPASEPATA